MRSLLIAALLTFALASCAWAQDGEAESRDYKWYAMGYAGKVSRLALLDHFSTDWRSWNDYMLGASVGRELWGFRDWFAFEGEVLASAHFGESGTFFETGGLILLRWLKFPWDRWVDTSFAIGDGVSWYSDDSADYEEYMFTTTYGLLNLFVVEGTFAHPEWERTSIVIRAHHRCDFWGEWKGANGGSTVPTIGLRYEF